MKVFIANATRQVLDFHYRLPERRSVIRQIVPYLSQTRLSMDLQRPQIDAILDQWEKYGLVELGSLETVRDDFHGYLLSVDRYVPLPKLERAVSYHEVLLDKRTMDMGEMAAMAMVDNWEKTLPREADPPARYEISVIQEHNPRDETPNPVARGYRVINSTADGSPPPGPPGMVRAGRKGISRAA